MSSVYTTSDIVNRVFLFCEELAGGKLRPYQAEFAKRILRSVIAGEGEELTSLWSRQCLKKGSMVHTRDGKVMRIEEVPGAWKSFDSKECFRVHVKGGYSVYATANHPIYTKEGWKFVEDLKVGDFVAVLEEWDKFGNGTVPYRYEKYVGSCKKEYSGSITMNDDLAELLGWITTDGSFSPRQSTKFTNTNMDCINRVKELVGKLFPSINPKLYAKGNGWDLLLTTGNKGIHNPLNDFLKKMDFDLEAEFPRALSYFTKSQLISYFRAAFSCDGYAHLKREGRSIEIGGLGSSNHYAYTDFHRELLNKLGISGNIKSELMAKNKDGSKFNRIVISGQHNASKFIEVFGDIIGKEIPDISKNCCRTLAYENFKDEDGEILTFKQITSIKSDGNHEVWDMEVTEKGWFICGGVKVHNSGKSHTVSVVMSGLSVILPILANMPMFYGDKRLAVFKDGFRLGIFAPSQKQARIIFNNVKRFLSSPHSCDILTDPEINVVFDVSNGENVSMKFKNLGNITSKIACITASETANIEGESCMIIVVDEAQDVADFVYRKSICPMGSNFNATRVLIGTSTTKRGFFLESIERNKKEYADGIIKKAHFENNYLIVQKYNDNYRKYIIKMKKELGEDSDEFQMSFCVAPETRILTSDLRWVKAETIKKGDALVGFDEEPPKRYAARRFKKSFVEDVGRIERPCYKLTFDDGTVVTCSSEHQWLTFTAGARTEWTKTEDLVLTDRVYRPITPWKTHLPGYKTGYLSAAFDGEGHVSQVDGKIGQVCFAQKDNVMFEKVKQYLDDLGYDYNVRLDTRSNVYKLYLLGGRDAYFRFLGNVRPQRILDKFDLHVTGTMRYCGHKNTGFKHPRLVSKEFVGVQEVIPIRTTTRTYIAEGLASHNCLKWLLSRGMFITAERLDAIADTSADIYLADKSKAHVAGIDLGKSKDSTVITILEVDWDNPVIIEESKDPDVPDFAVYSTMIKHWVELQGDDWNEQESDILTALEPFEISKVVIDATGVGSSVYDHLNVVLSQRGVEAIPYAFSTQSKSALFKFLDSQIKGGRAKYPACADLQENSREYKRFVEQMSILEKSYSGQHMVCAAPNNTKAHDDYPVSWALAQWAARGEPGVKVEVVQNNIFKPSPTRSNYYYGRNRYTARR